MNKAIDFVLSAFFQKERLKNAVNFSISYYIVGYIMTFILFIIFFTIMKFMDTTDKFTIAMVFSISFIEILKMTITNGLLFLCLFLLKRAFTLHIKGELIIKGLILSSVVRSLTILASVLLNFPFGLAYLIYCIFFLRFYFLTIENEKSDKITGYILSSFFVLFIIGLIGLRIGVIY